MTRGSSLWLNAGAIFINSHKTHMSRIPLALALTSLLVLGSTGAVAQDTPGWVNVPIVAEEPPPVDTPPSVGVFVGELRPQVVAPPDEPSPADAPQVPTGGDSLPPGIPMVPASESGSEALGATEASAPVTSAVDAVAATSSEPSGEAYRPEPVPVFTHMAQAAEAGVDPFASEGANTEMEMQPLSEAGSSLPEVAVPNAAPSEAPWSLMDSTSSRSSQDLMVYAALALAALSLLFSLFKKLWRKKASDN